MNIQLTISLLASDRMDTLGKCLDSITPLLRELNSELIIVYTGKDPAVLELARKYTPHIIPFTWCDDFSKARNAGLEQANGEWFLFLDDDEWFEDTTEIIQFFKSGEYKSYCSATYRQRNHSNWSGRDFTDVNVGRMCRLMPETRFIYAIHENLSPFNEPQKYFTSYVHHYGYVEKPLLRSDRNLPLLLKRLEEDRTSQTCMQIALEYYNKEDYNNALDYCRQGLQLSKGRKSINSYDLWMQVHLPVFLASLGKKEEAIQEGERMISSNIPDVPQAHLYAILSDLYKEVKEYEKGLNCSLAFHKKIMYLEKHPEKAECQTGGTITFATAKERSAVSLIAGLFCAAALNEPEQIQQLLSWLPWEEEGKLLSYYKSLEQWKEEHPEHEEAILRAYSYLNTDNGYVNLQKALYAEKKQMPEKTEEFFKSAAKNCPQEFMSQIVELAERNRFPLTPLIENISPETWTACVKELAKQTSATNMPERLEKLCLLMPEYPLFTIKIEQLFLEKLFLHGIVEGEQLLDLLGQYCKSMRTEAEGLYHAEILSNPDHYALPCQYKFAFLIEIILKNLKNGNYMDCIPLLKKGLHLYPEMSAIISRLNDYMEEQLNSPGQPVSEEFQALGGQIKQMLLGLIRNGQWQEAYGITKQLTSLLPDDLEILKLKQEIIMHL